MKNTRKEERKQSCERTSQKPDSAAPVQVLDHQRRFGDTALPWSAARRTREQQGRETTAQKVSQFSESQMNRSTTPVYRTSPVYIEGSSPSQIRSTQIPETALWNLYTCNQSTLMWQSRCDRINQQKARRTKINCSLNTPCHDVIAQVTSHVIITRKMWNARARACVFMHVHIAALMSFVLLYKTFTYTSLISWYTST
jgi:hypothetical protein